MIKKRLEFALKPLRIARMAYSDPNRFRYWLYKKTGTKFRPKAPDFPPMVLLEPTNYCNLSCIHCAYRTLLDKSDYNQGFMDFALYKKIIDEISEHKYTILRPFDRGEALINQQLPEMIKYAKKKCGKRIYIWLNTNGLLLTPRKSKQLLESGLDQLEVSIDAATETTFSRIKGVDGKILRKVADNTIQYCQLKKELYPNKKLIISFVESEINILEKDSFVNFWHNYADHVNIRPVHQHGALIKENLRVTKKNKKQVQRLPCSIIWKRVSIDYQGNLRFCEVDWELKGIMGSIKDSCIEDIWNSKNYKELRGLHIEKRFSEIPLCSICKSYNEAGGW